MNTVVFKDADTKEFISSHPTNWKFEVGQVFKGFWGCTSTVTEVELRMDLESDWIHGGEVRYLVFVQIVWIKRTPIKS